MQSEERKPKLPNHDRTCEQCERATGAGPMTRFCPVCRNARRRKATAAPPYTEAEDQAIRDAYNKHHGRKALHVLELQLKSRPRWSLKRRAQSIGCATIRAKEPPWSKTELDLLSHHAHLAPARIAIHFRRAKLARTVTAIAIMRKRLQLRKTLDGTSAHALSELLGIDSKTVIRWIETNRLKAIRAGTSGKDGKSWFIPTKCFRKFLLAHFELVDLGKAERAGSKMWLFELLAGGTIGVGLAEPEEMRARPPSLVADEAAHAGAQRNLSARIGQQVLDALDAAGKPIGWLSRRLGMKESDLAEQLAGALTLPLLASIGLELGCEVRLELEPRAPAHRRAA